MSELQGSNQEVLLLRSEVAAQRVEIASLNLKLLDVGAEVASLKEKLLEVGQLRLQMDALANSLRQQVRALKARLTLPGNRPPTLLSPSQSSPGPSGEALPLAPEPRDEQSAPKRRRTELAAEEVVSAELHRGARPPPTVPSGAISNACCGALT
jgi:small-conductance mechanosensitive channel